MKSKGNFQNFGGRESKNLKNSTCQWGESSYNKHGGQRNFIGEGRSLTRARISAISVNDSIILQKNAIQTRKNLKGMKPRLQDKSLMKIIHSWSWSCERIVAANNCINSNNDKKLSCGRLNDIINRVHKKEDAMMSLKGVHCSEEWYLDSGCLTHMTGRKDWFVKINRAMKNKVKFADDTILMVDEIDDVLIMIRDDGYSLIKDVWYILRIKCNLLSIFQFLEKGYKIHMENKGLHVMDANGVFVLKTLMAANRTFKAELKVMEHKCLATAVSREEWMWHYRLGHLNFRDLKDLQKNGMVTRLSSINIL
ncbi:uncharacterized protein LOC127087999 [Lathyrus oleraceus]|uniref:uncharacterized protein LOC127087999 n=1 Tax=Pisum sativum TaxID=3888 RepID=UPI0021CF6D3A|nr:uncharacterized protein LOC127087999 [Pisum sativum]